MKTLITLALITVLFFSCTSTVYVSVNTLNQWKEYGIDPKKLQYYNDYVFWWDTKSTESNNAVKDGGVLQSSQKVNYKTTRINGQTPCTITEIGGLYINVLFEEGGEPIKFWRSDKKPYFTLEHEIQYGKAIYKRESSIPIGIYVKSKDLKKVTYEKHKMKGVKVQ